MKVRITQKDVRATHKKVFATGANSLWHLFNTIQPYAYNCGVYGWNCDIYSIGVFAIVTGYRTFGKWIPNEIVKKYEKQAESICNQFRFEYENKKTLYQN